MKIDHQQLKPATLDNILTEFILREGTDYGAQELTLSAKKGRLQRLLETGQCSLCYDPDSDSVTLVATPSN